MGMEKEGEGNGGGGRAGQHGPGGGRRDRYGRRRGVASRRVPAEGGREMAGSADIWSIRKGAGFSEGLPECLAEHDRKPPRRCVRLNKQIPELGSGRPGKMGASWLCLHTS